VILITYYISKIKSAFVGL